MKMHEMHGNVWKCKKNACMKMSENARTCNKCMNMHESVRKYMRMHEHAGTCMKTQENVRKCMKMHAIKCMKMYENAGRYIYVNRGFGFHAYPGRVGIMPEITVIELKKGENVA